MGMLPRGGPGALGLGVLSVSGTKNSPTIRFSSFFFFTSQIEKMDQSKQGGSRGGVGVETTEGGGGGGRQTPGTGTSEANKTIKGKTVKINDTNTEKRC